ncbi:MAG: radical SAM/SPASM domain-containing protein [Verrucomicrobiia bacterium]
MFFALTKRLITTVNPRLLWKFLWNFGFKGLIASEKFKRRIKRGEYFPAYLHISITNQCNLKCQGCWVDVDAPVEMISYEELDKIIKDCKKHGNNFFGILGGEPFFHPDIFKIIENHPDCYFQVFTNGQPITKEVASRLRAAGNVSPLISIEGDEVVSDERRGGKEVFNRTFAGLKNCLEAGLLTGVATSLCKNNIDTLLTEQWLKRLIDVGVHYVWYYAYRPVGAVMRTDLALTAEQLIRSRKFIVEMRCRLPIIIIDAYYDHLGRSLCPSATGLSHHINWRGEIEPCPVIQFACQNIRDGESIYELISKSEFLKDYRKTASGALRGCIVLERPDLLKSLVLKHNARDTTARQTVLKELDAMEPKFSQWLPGYEIPEKHWMYYWMKKLWFNDFGAYKDAQHNVEAKRVAVRTALADNPELASESVNADSQNKMMEWKKDKQQIEVCK